MVQEINKGLQEYNTSIHQYNSNRLVDASTSLETISKLQNDKSAMIENVTSLKERNSSITNHLQASS